MQVQKGIFILKDKDFTCTAIQKINMHKIAGNEGSDLYRKCTVKANLVKVQILYQEFKTLPWLYIVVLIPYQLSCGHKPHPHKNPRQTQLTSTSSFFNQVRCNIEPERKENTLISITLHQLIRSYGDSK